MKSFSDFALILVSIIFGLAGAFSLAITDIVFVPRIPGAEIKYVYITEPLYLASATLPPMVFAFFACYKGIRQKNRLFGGWFSIGMFSGLSLALNPIIWVLILSTFFFFGLVIFFVFLATSGVLRVAMGRLRVSHA